MGKGSARGKGFDLDGENSSVGSPRGDKSPGSSSPPSSEAASEDNREASPPLPDETEDTAEYEPIKLQMMGRPFSPDLLKDEDNELWLVRLPRYDAFVKALDDRDIQVVDKEDNAEKWRGGITSRLKGYYVFRDSGEVDKGERAVFVTKGRDGRERMEIAKPFAHSMQVTFDAPLKNQSDRAPPPREYPVAPKGLTLKYRPIGSETASAPKTANGSLFLTSPTRKRKLSAMSESEASEPVIPDLAQASFFSSPLKNGRYSEGIGINPSLQLTPEQKSPFRLSGATLSEESSPSQQGPLSLNETEQKSPFRSSAPTMSEERSATQPGPLSPNGREPLRQGTQKSPRRKKSETRRRLKTELT